MAVYERAYRPYTGTLTPRSTRFLVLPRYALSDTFRSRAFVAFYVVCFLWPVLLMLATYVSYNLKFLELLAAMGATFEPGTLFGLRFDNEFFLYGFMLPQFWLALFLTAIVAPALIAPDLGNNGLPLYLCRPFTKRDYIVGKSWPLWLLLSSVTWVPGLLLFLLNAYLAGGGWLWEHLRAGVAILVGSGVVIVILTLIGLSLSAYVRFKPMARLGLFGVFLLGSGLGNLINGMLGTEWGSVIDLSRLIAVTWGGLFGVAVPLALSPAAAWASLAGLALFFLWLLFRKLEAYEVVR